MSSSNGHAGILRRAMCIEDAAYALDMKPQDIRRAIDLGELSAHIVPGRKAVKIHVDDLDEWFKTLPAAEARAVL